jgi:uncharacterized protein
VASRVVFADTSFLLALCHPKDPYRDKAEELDTALLSAQMVTSELVLIELLNGVCKYGPDVRDFTVTFIEKLRSTRRFEFVRCSSERFAQAIRFYEQMSDKAWSLTDCDSILAMRHRGITEAATTDRHFEQAGCVALMRH